MRYGSHIAVDQVGFHVERGEVVGLLGPNGAGKTSTLSAIEGLITPAHGTITVDGADVARQPIEANARLGVHLQASSFQAELSIEQIVRLYAGLYGVRLSHGQITDRMRDIGLAGELGKPFKKLSGGQQQRLSLFIAVIHQPSLLLLDEPTAGLDPQSRRQLWQRVDQFRADGSGIVLTTHSMEEVQAVCDRIVIIDHGRVLATGTPADLIAAHRDDRRVRDLAHGEVTLDDVFIALTGAQTRD
ncbi:ABC-2 type transport system ATP-binding protein [Actinocrispum wychmicini]|uniref:ABC-2 type transport system ATP-binding protein n=1 Tax=Actinocrispum wychmicini TaxID=1213861 RepID=A0A4R2JI39_9PSEU|nr:ABC-2 type transport system ATP-binding protein [Actinocrispum wychmicini]